MGGKKILIGIDNSQSSQAAVDFAIKHFSNKEILLVGVFIDDLSYVGYTEKEDAEDNAPIIECPEKENIEKKRKEQITNFSDQCYESSVRFIIHNPKGSTAKELIKESKYADLMIIGYKAYLSTIRKEEATYLLKDLLIGSLCPVLIIPEKLEDINNIILTFDGDHSSIHSIKQFCYLLPELCKKNQATLLTDVTNEEEDISADEEKLLVEYMKQHFKNLGIHKVSNETQNHLLHALEFNSNSIVVIGTDNNQSFSALFNFIPSGKFPEPIKPPAFIAHW